MEVPAPIRDFARTIDEREGALFVVGGSVRDHCLGLPANDIDLEVHGVPLDVLRTLLPAVGRVKEVGRSFGVFKLRIGRVEVDVAVPTRSREPGADAGVPDVHMGLLEATRRRDLTVNALLWNVLTEEIVDLHQGMDDLADRCLREVDPETFSEDPLRPLRSVRLAAQLGFTFAPSLKSICTGARLAGVPPERIRGELLRILSDTARPGEGLRLIGELALAPSVFPEVPLTIDSELVAALERAVLLRDALRSEADQTLVMLGVLFASVEVDAVGRWMDWLRINRVRGRALRRTVEGIVTSVPEVLAGVTDARLCELADVLPLDVLIRVAAAYDPKRRADLDRAQRLGVSLGPLPRLVTGTDLLRAGIEAGASIGRALEWVRGEQLAGRLCSREEALDALRQGDWNPSEGEG